MTRSTRLTVTLVMFCTADLTFSCTFSATEGIRAPNSIIRCRVMLAVLIGIIIGIIGAIVKFGWEVPFPPRTPLQVFQLFVLPAAGHLGNAVHFQCGTAGDLTHDLGRNLKAAALKIHVL